MFQEGSDDHPRYNDDPDGAQSLSEPQLEGLEETNRGVVPLMLEMVDMLGQLVEADHVERGAPTLRRGAGQEQPEEQAGAGGLGSRGPGDEHAGTDHGSGADDHGVGESEPALESGRFQLVSTTGSLRVLRRVD